MDFTQNRHEKNAFSWTKTNSYYCEYIFCHCQYMLVSCSQTAIFSFILGREKIGSGIPTIIFLSQPPPVLP